MQTSFSLIITLVMAGLMVGIFTHLIVKSSKHKP